MQCKYNSVWTVTYLGPGLPRRLGLCGHGALQLNGQSDVLAAWGGGREIKVSKKRQSTKGASRYELAFEGVEGGTQKADKRKGGCMILYVKRRREKIIRFFRTSYMEAPQPSIIPARPPACNHAMRICV